jgi:hypothetical protein
MNPWKQLISDGEQPSLMRVIALIVVVCVVPPMMVVWVILSLRQNAFVVPPAGFITLLSVVFGAKSFQSFAENFTGIHFSLPPVPQPTTTTEKPT